MKLTGKQIKTLTEILDDMDDNELIDTIITLRSYILLGAVEPFKTALFTNDILTHEAFRRGLDL